MSRSPPRVSFWQDNPPPSPLETTDTTRWQLTNFYSALITGRFPRFREPRASLGGEIRRGFYRLLRLTSSPKPAERLARADFWQFYGSHRSEATSSSVQVISSRPLWGAEGLQADDVGVHWLVSIIRNCRRITTDTVVVTCCERV